jgi:hypothetical protein
MCVKEVELGKPRVDDARVDVVLVVDGVGRGFDVIEGLVFRPG